MSEGNTVNVEKIKNKLQNFKKEIEKNKTFTQEEKEELNKITEYLSNKENINKINKLNRVADFIFFYYNKEKEEIGCTIDTPKINELIIEYNIGENYINSCGYFDENGKLNGRGEEYIDWKRFISGYYEHGKFIRIIKKVEQKQNTQQNQQYQTQLNNMLNATKGFEDINKTDNRGMGGSNL